MNIAANMANPRANNANMVWETISLFSWLIMASSPSPATLEVSFGLQHSPDGG